MPPVRAGAELIRTLLPAEPRFAPLKLTTPPEPAARVRLARVRAAFWPLPGVMATVEEPAARVTAPNVSVEPAPALPRKLSVPPARVTGAASLTRLALLAAVLSRVR